MSILKQIIYNSHAHAEKESINQSRTKAQVNEMNGFVAMMTACLNAREPGPLQCHIEPLKRAEKKNHANKQVIKMRARTVGHKLIYLYKATMYEECLFCPEVFFGSTL